MGKLLKEAALDDRFSAQMKKVQDALVKLRDIVDESRANSTHYLTSTQKMQLRHAAEDFKTLYDKA
jgi:hypothetical protein